jgi:hypothetical protein
VGGTVNDPENELNLSHSQQHIEYQILLTTRTMSKEKRMKNHQKKRRRKQEEFRTIDQDE